MLPQHARAPLATPYAACAPARCPGPWLTALRLFGMHSCTLTAAAAPLHHNLGYMFVLCAGVRVRGVEGSGKHWDEMMIMSFYLIH